MTSIILDAQYRDAALEARLKNRTRMESVGAERNAAILSSKIARVDLNLVRYGEAAQHWTLAGDDSYELGDAEWSLILFRKAAREYSRALKKISGKGEKGLTDEGLLMEYCEEMNRVEQHCGELEGERIIRGN